MRGWEEIYKQAIEEGIVKPPKEKKEPAEKKKKIVRKKKSKLVQKHLWNKQPKMEQLNWFSIISPLFYPTLCLQIEKIWKYKYKSYYNL